MDSAPLFEPVYTETKRNWGFSVHFTKGDFDQKERVSLSVYSHPYVKRKCRDCGKEFGKGAVIGTDSILRPYCEKCVDIPAGLQACRVVFKMKRKTKSHPTGQMSIYRIQTPEKLREHFEKWAGIYEKIEEKIIWTS